jgi:hypothetical protein
MNIPNNVNIEILNIKGEIKNKELKTLKHNSLSCIRKNQFLYLFYLYPKKNTIIHSIYFSENNRYFREFYYKQKIKK